jgi:hypothetical protein
MSEKEETSSSERVKADEFILKRANQTDIKEKRKRKGQRLKWM